MRVSASGGMGSVYEASSCITGDVRALEVMRPNLASQIFEAVSDVNEMMEDTLQRVEEINDHVQGLRAVSGSVSQLLMGLQGNGAAKERRYAE